MGKKNGKRVTLSTSDIPLLRAYLREVHPFPPHVPTWIPTAGWIAFVALAILTLLIGEKEVLLLIGSAVLSYLLVYLLRKRFPPRNEQERTDEMRFSVIRKMKDLLENGLHKRVPPEVLKALEEAVEARNLAIARLSLTSGYEVFDQTAMVERGLQACFLAAAPVIRGNECSNGEWQSLLANRNLIGGIVELIQNQTSVIRDSLGSDQERLEALRELAEGHQVDSLRISG